MYTNLLFFLTAIFLFSMDSGAATNLLPGPLALVCGLGLLYLFDRVARVLFARPQALSSTGYFSVEKRLSVLAVVCYGAVLYFCDAKHYFSFLSMGDNLPALVNIAGLSVFVLFFCLIWRNARGAYAIVFGRRHSTSSFVWSNIRSNLPIVLPWIILSLLSDLVSLLPIPQVQALVASEWGDMVFFLFFLLFVVLLFPPLVRRLWGCTPLPDGEMKAHLLRICRKQNFKAELYVWPLFEGRVLTAGVMGIFPGLRYILVTPALMETMNLQELEAVMTHEIGHVKKRHLLLYLFLIGGFSLFAGVLAEPFFYFFLSRDYFYSLVVNTDIMPGTLATVLGAVPLLVCMLLYFRYVFGYFLRNFERQADLQVFPALGGCAPLISAFEKIAGVSGDLRDQPNWHHYGIGERIDYLKKCEGDRAWVGYHNRKVRWSLIGYGLILVAGVWMASLLPTEQLARHYEDRFAEAVFMQKARQEPDQTLWLRLVADLMFEKKMERRAFIAYNKALEMEPTNPIIKNNLAWLLLTSEDLSLRDPLRALTLARTAAATYPKGYVLDTLATAYWANGLVREAVASEEEAIFVDPTKRDYYESQAARFASESYVATLEGSPQASTEDPQAEGRN